MEQAGSLMHGYEDVTDIFLIPNTILKKFFQFFVVLDLVWTLDLNMSVLSNQKVDLCG